MYKPSSNPRMLVLFALVGLVCACGATAAQLPTEPGCPEAVPTLGTACSPGNRNSVCEYRDSQDQLTVRECREEPTRGAFVWQAAIGLGGSSGGAVIRPTPPPSPPPTAADASTGEADAE